MGFESIFSTLSNTVLPAAANIYSAYKNFTQPYDVPKMPVANGAVQAPIIGDLPDLTGIPGLSKLPQWQVNPQDVTVGEQGLSNILQESSDLYRTLLDPTNPVFQRLAADNAALNKRDFLSQLREVSNANRRQASRGRTTFFSPERGDEDVIAKVAQNAADAETLGRMQAQQQLGNVAGSLSGLSGAYQGLSGLETGRYNDLQNQIATQLGQQRSDISAQDQFNIQKFLGSLGIKHQNIINQNEQQRKNVEGYMNAYPTIYNTNATNKQAQNTGAIQGMASIADLFANINKPKYNVLGTATSGVGSSGGGALPWKVSY